MNWINVKDRLPIPNERSGEARILTVDTDNYVSIDYYAGKEFYTDLGIPVGDPITHWAPIPKTPNNE